MRNRKPLVRLLTLKFTILAFAVTRTGSTDVSTLNVLNEMTGRKNVTTVMVVVMTWLTPRMLALGAVSIGVMQGEVVGRAVGVVVGVGVRLSRELYPG